MRSASSTLVFFFALLSFGCLSARIDAYCDGIGPCNDETVAGMTGASTSTASSSQSSSTDVSDGTSQTDTDTSPDASTSPDDSTANTSTVSSSTADMTTTEVSPVCGNGIVESDEECDDGDLVPDNGCSDTCAADIRAFVSSVTYKAGELMSLVLADARCFNRAADAGLPEPLRFKAFLSDSQTDARDRFKGRGRIVFVNGIVFANSWGALLGGELLGPMEVTEKSETYHGKVWTGTGPNGTAVLDSTHCADWSTNSVFETAYYGYSDEVSAEWLLADQLDNPAECPAPLAIYCFETS